MFKGTSCRVVVDLCSVYFKYNKLYALCIKCQIIEFWVIFVIFKCYKICVEFEGRCMKVTIASNLTPNNFGKSQSAVTMRLFLF